MVEGGNFVTKVIYLPDPKYQELAVAGVEDLVSTRLEQGVDLILEADKRGTILLISLVFGAIDLEMQNGSAAGMYMVPGTTTTVAPGALPPGAVPPPPPATESVPVDTAGDPGAAGHVADAADAGPGNAPARPGRRGAHARRGRPRPLLI